MVKNRTHNVCQGFASAVLIGIFHTIACSSVLADEARAAELLSKANREPGIGAALFRREAAVALIVQSASGDGSKRLKAVFADRILFAYWLSLDRAGLPKVEKENFGIVANTARKILKSHRRIDPLGMLVDGQFIGDFPSMINIRKECTPSQYLQMVRVYQDELDVIYSVKASGD